MWIKMKADHGDHKAGQEVDLADAEAGKLVSLGVAEKMPTEVNVATLQRNIVDTLTSEVRDRVRAELQQSRQSPTDPASRVGAVITDIHDRIYDDPRRGFASFAEFGLDHRKSDHGCQ